MADKNSRILQILGKSPIDLTINEIAKQLGVNRNTTAKYLEVLQARGIVEHRVVGKAKLYSPVKK